MPGVGIVFIKGEESLVDWKGEMDEFGVVEKGEEERLDPPLKLEESNGEF